MAFCFQVKSDETLEPYSRTFIRVYGTYAADIYRNGDDLFLKFPDNITSKKQEWNAIKWSFRVGHRVNFSVMGYGSAMKIPEYKVLIEALKSRMPRQENENLVKI